MIDGTFRCILMESMIIVWGEKKVLNLLPLLKGQLYSGERDTFSESWNLGLTCNQGGGRGDTLAVKGWLSTKRVDISKCTLITIIETFTNWSNLLKSIKCTCVNST